MCHFIKILDRSSASQNRGCSKYINPRMTFLCSNPSCSFIHARGRKVIDLFFVWKRQISEDLSVHQWKSTNRSGLVARCSQIFIPIASHCNLPLPHCRFDSSHEWEFRSIRLVVVKRMNVGHRAPIVLLSDAIFVFH